MVTFRGAQPADLRLLKVRNLRETAKELERSWHEPCKLQRMVFRFVLSLALLMASLPGLAGPLNPVSGPVTIQAQPYFSRCEGLLAALDTETIEDFFIEQVRSPEQALGLLAEYGLVSSEPLNFSILMALDKRGLHHPGILTSDNPRKFREFTKGLLRIAQMGDAEFITFADDVLNNFVTSVNSTTESNPQTEIQSLIVNRFVEALRKSDNPYLRPMFQRAVRVAILNTVHDPMAEEALAGRYRSFAEHAETFPIIAGIQLFAFALMHTADHSLGFRQFLIMLTAGLIPSLSIYFFRTGLRFQRLRLPRSLPVAADLRTNMDPDVPPQQLRNLFQDSKKSVTQLAVSLDEICAAPSICRWTPVQLAYLGHLDLVELKMMEFSLRAALASLDLDSKFSELREIASQLRARSDNRNAQVQFRQQLLWTVESAIAAQQVVEGQLKNLEDKIENLRRQLLVLRDRAFREFPKQLGSEADSKRRLILGKLDGDLTSLLDLESGRGQILGRFAQIQSVLKKLSDVNLTGSHPPEDWRAAAAEALVLIDSLEATKPN
jgi:hypothetical protein